MNGSYKKRALAGELSCATSPQTIATNPSSPAMIGVLPSGLLRI